MPAAAASSLITGPWPQQYNWKMFSFHVALYKGVKTYWNFTGPLTPQWPIYDSRTSLLSARLFIDVPHAISFPGQGLDFQCIAHIPHFAQFHRSFFFSSTARCEPWSKMATEEPIQNGHASGKFEEDKQRNICNQLFASMEMQLFCQSNVNLDHTWSNSSLLSL